MNPAPLDESTERRRTSRSTATRSMLVEAAAELFATRGYASTSIRDVAARVGLTTGAIYGQFRNKADLLAEAIGDRISAELDAQCQMLKQGGSHVEALTKIAHQYRRRSRLRALLLQAAVAAQEDEETLHKMREQQLLHLRTWAAEYEANRDAFGIDPSLDLQAAVLYTWAAEVGLGVLEVFGITPDSTDGWSDMAGRVGRSFRIQPQQDT